MTAPTAPDTSSAPQSASEILQSDDASFAKMFGLEDVVRAPSEAETTSETSEDQTSERVRDEKGRFVPKDQQNTEEPSETAEDAPGVEGEKAKKPLANFKAFDKEGELDVPADLEIEFKADGEVRKLPLDKLIRHAQNGVYNERLVREVEETRGVLPQLQSALQEKDLLLRQQVALNARLMQDEEYFLTQREAFLREQTPEVQLQKMQQYMQQMQQTQRQEAENRAGQDFVNNGLVPAMEAMLEQFPEVTWEEAFGRFSLLTAPLMRDGRVPMDQFERVYNLVQHDIGQWMAQRASGRRALLDNTRKTLEETQRRAAETVTKQKRQLARALSPMAGRAAPDTQKPKPVTTAEEGMNAILSSIASGGIG